MAQQTYRANLSAAIFPLTLASAGRSVIIPGPDNTYDRRVDPEGEQKNAGIPQAIYLENVIPTANGYQSVGTEQITALTLATGKDVYRVITIEDYTYIFANEGGGYTLGCYRSPKDDLITWTDFSATWFGLFGGPYIEGFLPQNTLSLATVRGNNYFFVANGSQLGLSVAGGLSDVSGSVVGITVANIQCILASYNYLIAILDDGSIAWSSTTTSLDFTPSLVTGAGSTTPNAIRSDIVAAHACPEGFILYTETNAVLASYTGNSRYPWKFREIPNSGGHASERLVAAPIDSAYHFTIDTHGSVTQIQAGESNKLAVEVSTYLRSGNATLDTFAAGVFTSTVSKLAVYQINFFLNRYLMLHFKDVAVTTKISHKITVVYDILSRRYGRIYGASSQFWATQDSLYGVSDAGVIVKYIFDTQDESIGVVWNGTLVLGRFQYARSRNLCIDEISLEGDVVDISTYVVPTLDGKTNIAPVVGAIETQTDTLQTTTYRVEGKNHLVAINGRFDISSLELTFHLGGAR